jgi:hypothetical protein
MPTRYLGIGIESTYGTQADPLFFVTHAQSTLDTPKKSLLLRPTGLGRVDVGVDLGAYIPEGGIELVADPAIMPVFWYLVLGGDPSTNSSSVSPKSESAPSNSSGVISKTLSYLPVVPGSFTLKLTDTLVAQDDGFGKIEEVGSSGITGTIDYSTGALRCTGASPSQTYTAYYSAGTYVHTISLDTELLEMPSATLYVGKDVFEHIFLGACFTSFTLEAERDYITVSMDVAAQKDLQDTIKTTSEVLALTPQSYPCAFHAAAFKLGTYGSTLNDMSASVEKLTLNLDLGADAEGGVTIGSRFPRRIWTGETEITLELTLVFSDTTMLEAFWGSSSGAGSTLPTEFAGQIIVTGNNLGSFTISLPRLIIESSKLQPKGRDRLSQEITARVLLDKATSKILEVENSSVYDPFA